MFTREYRRKVVVTFKCIGLLWSLLLTSILVIGQGNEKQLLVRIDDMGFSHSANVACINAYKDGIARSVEVLVPGPWFEEAAQMLAKYPDLDVGVHLALTSEWSNLKWRPITHCPSLTDADGYFFPMIWPRADFPSGTCLKEADWKIAEIEQELRAQIELAIKKIPRISHLTDHMGCLRMNASTKQLLKRLAKEYGLEVFPEEQNVGRLPAWSGQKYTAKQKEKRLIAVLQQLEPGTWMTVEHPAYDDEEMRTVGHIGYENVAFDRNGVTHAMTSKKVKKAIEKLGIKLISYRDLR